MKLKKTFIYSIVVLIVMGLAAAALAARYVDNGDGTVTDTMTGLIWQKANDGNLRNLPAARTYCDNLDLGGSQDWRMPRLDELETIVDYARYDLSLDPVFTHVGAESGYWPDTKFVYPSDYFFYVVFLSGGVSYTEELVAAFVRCVRGGPFWPLDPSDHLEAYGEEIVRDTRNFKMWQRSDAGNLTWDEANQYCNLLTTGGYTDWRLPSIEELETIIDYTKILPAMSTVFNLSRAQGGNYWTTTPYVKDPTYVWHASFSWGVVGVAEYGTGGLLYGRCVRDDPPYFITVAVAPSGAGSVTKNPDRSATYYSYGEVVTLTATADPGFMFKEWTKDGAKFPNPKGSKNSSIQITVDDDVSLTANFLKLGKKK